MEKIKYEIVEHLGVLSESEKGWKKELNLISWNQREPKYDIRDWSENHEKMGKGITLSKDETMKLRNILNNNLKCSI
ncbi:MAG: hypothetical protein BHW00_07110 [Clostridium sp. 26_22]|nr:MAG: hypothetical protein BHW00_07110 [Clostridium sp. 26_22]